MNEQPVAKNVRPNSYDECMPRQQSEPLPAQTIADWLTALTFSNRAGESKWSRSFPSHNHTITVDVADTGTISYGPGIIIGRGTILNLLDAENLVVLECVVSLLDAGYSPDSIELERAFQLGHRPGGWLDVLVKRGEKTYMMVECKTAGAEFTKELRNLTTKPSNQLLSYLLQDRDLEQAVLYSSQVVREPGADPRIEREYAGFATTYLIGNNTKALFNNWNKELYRAGLMDSQPYTVHEKSLTVGDLQDMTQTDGQQLFNLFKEILRRHAVSDNPNAFNKIFNLFICKILDEDSADDSAVTEFQWRGSEDATIVLERLSGLYDRGMREYLKLNIEQPGNKLADATAGLTKAQREAVGKLLAEVRQYNNPNFAFIDVYDKESYEQNAEIVRDIVRLLQTRRLRYTQKHGFMGMFFEQLLNTSMKQESGQFFTPGPIAQFVTESLPMEQLISRKIQKKDPEFLPYAIDYAAGSGHFLTEYMDRIHKVLDKLPPTGFLTNTQKGNASRWVNGGLAWAGEFVYGIELDYRLAKTAKVSTFLNGDGDARVIRGNGLGHFLHDEDFKKAGGKLVRASNSPEDRDIGTFDVVVANPPYSVAEFAATVEHGAESFELWKSLGDKSDKIEALFIERTKHLLTDHGVAGLVLPTSLLTNDGVEVHARAMMLRYFDIVGIVTLGDRVFIATDTPCSIVFLRRRPNSESAAVSHAIKEFISSGTDSTILGVAGSIAEYASTVHNSTLDSLYEAVKSPTNSMLQMFDDYEWALANRSNKSTETRLCDDNGDPTIASPKLLEFVLENEIARMEAYFLTRGKSTVLVRAPENSTAKKKFLGYEFSERKRHEGISFLSGTGSIQTPLFDPENSSNPDKVSSLIKSHFEGNPIPVPAELSQWAEVVPTSDVVGLSDMVFKWSLSTIAQPPALNFVVPTKRLGDVCSITIGGTPSRQRPEYFRGDELWLSVSEMNESVIQSTKEKVTANAVAASNLKKVKKGTLLMSFKLSIGKTAIAGADMYTNEAIAALVPKLAPANDLPWVDTEYLHVLIRLLGPEILRHTTQAQKKIGRSLNMAYLKRLSVPLLDAAGRAAVVAIASDTSLSAKEQAERVSAMLWEAV